MSKTLDLLLRQWPGKVALTPEEVAVVLSRQPDTIRDKMRDGSLPGAVKRGGRWVLPLPDLADYIDPPDKSPPPVLPAAPVLAKGVAPTRRRRAIVMNYRTDLFWAQVAHALGALDTADMLESRAKQLRAQYTMDYLTDRAERRREQLMAIAGLPDPASGED